jgi:hypothetical protein
LRDAGAASICKQKGQLEPGYSIGDVQQICLKSDNTWYGTTFDFGGSWINNPPNISNVKGAIYGNYRVAGMRGKGFANSAVTISLPVGDRTKLVADWYDWFDDFSYHKYVTALLMARVKDNCDPPFKGQNTHAATE